MAPSEFINRFWYNRDVTAYMCRRSDSLDSLSAVMHERKAVFSSLNDLTAEHLVTGKVHIILIRALTLGYIEVVCLKVMHLASCI